MFERILHWQKLFAASICRYLCIPRLTSRPKLRLSFTPPVSTIHELTAYLFCLLLPSCRPSIFHLHRFNIHQLSSVHLVISPLDWPSVYPSVASRHILPYINLSGLVPFSFRWGTVDWRNKTSAPGVARGLPWGPWGSDRAKTKWLRPTKDTGGGGGGRYERQR